MIQIYLTAFFLSLAASFIFIPLSISLAKKFGVMDQPDSRKVHTVAVPRWGGMGIALSFLISIAICYFFFPRFEQLLAYKYRISNGKIISLMEQFWGILLGSIFVLVLGMRDDKNPISAKVKLPLQIIASYVAMDYGVRLSGITLPFSEHYTGFPLIASQAITVLWLTGFMNTVNLVDGLDGLAAGICAIAAGTFLIVAVLQGQSQIAVFAKQLKLSGVLSAALCGSCIGFLWFNFYPAKVFMGDGGSLFLGFMLGTITVTGTLKTTAFFSLIIPIVVIALPILDVGVSIVRRWRNGKEIFAPDSDHLHHQLLRHGWTHRETVLGIYLVTLVFSVFSILLTIFKGKV